MDRMNKLQHHEGKFVEAVIAYLFIVNLLPVIIVPMMWYECSSGKIASIMNNWSDFEVGGKSVIKLRERMLPVNAYLSFPDGL